jgi:heat shock protein HslJ
VLLQWRQIFANHNPAVCGEAHPLRVGILQLANSVLDGLSLQGETEMFTQLIQAKSHRLLAGFSVLLMAVIFSFTLIGCQTTYSGRIDSDMSNVNRIAIEPRSVEVGFFSEQISATGKYTVAPEAELHEWRQWKSEQWNAQKKEKEQARAEIEISAADLVGAYTANTVRADSSYNGKLLKISGIIKEIGTSSKGNYFIRLSAPGQNDSVDVYFDRSELKDLQSVSKDQSVTVIGRCTGKKPPDMEDTAEILRILGGGSSINITDAKFWIDIHFADYTGSLDAVIYLNQRIHAEYGTPLALTFEIVRVSKVYVEDDPIIGKGEVSPFSSPDARKNAVNELISKLAALK